MEADARLRLSNDSGVIPGQKPAAPHVGDERPSVWEAVQHEEHGFYEKKDSNFQKPKSTFDGLYTLLAVFQSKRRMGFSDTLYICGMTNTHRVQHTLHSICRSWKEMHTRLMSFILHPVALYQSRQILPRSRTFYHISVLIYLCSIKGDRG